MKKPFKQPAKTAIARCKTCNSEYRREIEVGFVLGTNRVDSFRDRFNQSYKGAWNHWAAHCSPEYKAIVFAEARTHKAVGIVDGERTNILHTLERLSGDCATFLAQAHEQKDIPPHIKDASEMRAQLENFESVISSAGHMSFSAKSGTHDDLVSAASIGAFACTQAKPQTLKVSPITW